MSDGERRWSFERIIRFRQYLITRQQREEARGIILRDCILVARARYSYRELDDLLVTRVESR
jgi:hypothetical protein